MIPALQHQYYLPLWWVVHCKELSLRKNKSSSHLQAINRLTSQSWSIVVFRPSFTATYNTRFSSCIFQFLFVSYDSNDQHNNYNQKDKTHQPTQPVSESHHHTIIIPVHHLLLINYSILKRLLSMFTKIRQCKTYLVTYFFLKFIWFIDLFWGKKKVNM